MNRTTAKVIASTRHPEVPSAVITTLEVYAPRFLLAEINTHRVLAKSAASSRAIPVKKRIEMVRDHGFIPEAFGKNKPGMQADATLDEMQAQFALDAWVDAMNDAIIAAERLERQGVHKQHANRLLEPFAYYHGVITATEWDNFFALRLHPDAQPEFQVLAKAMKEAMDATEPVEDDAHLPYFRGDQELQFKGFLLRQKLNICAARCARVSYQTHDGKPFDLAADERRCRELITGGHMSPFDHAALADTTILEGRIGTDACRTMWQNPGDHRQFWGWIPDRVEVERIAGMPPGRRDSYAEITV